MIKHHYRERDIADVIKNGVKSGSRLQEEDVEFGRNIAHNYIYFRAPYIYTPQVDRSCIKNEIIASFGEVEKNCVYLRVDPAQTNTFSSEIRVEYRVPYSDDIPIEQRSCFVPNILIERRRAHELEKIEQQIQLSKKLMTKYFEIIENNKNLHQPYKGYTQIWDLLSSKKRWLDKSDLSRYPWNSHAIEQNSEVLIEGKYIGIHLPSECFAHVT